MKSVVIFLTLVVLVTVTTVSAQSDSCPPQLGFIGVLNQLIESRINSTLGDRVGVLVNRTLNLELEQLVENAFADKHVIRTVTVGVAQNRSFYVRLPSGQKEQLSLSDPSVSVRSSNNLLAYRPSYPDAHGSNLGSIFFNMQGIFPCIRLISTCGILTNEEHGFFQGRPFIQAGDGGNFFRIFSSTENIRTYGVAIQGCPQLNSTCLPADSSFTIFCVLPREHCG